MWQRNRDAFFRSWHVEVGGIVVEPFILLIAVGFGLGAYISNLGEGVSYPRFLAPGVIAAYAMFHATFDSTYGAYMRMESHHIYESILFTPLGPEDIVMGEVMWGATRALMSGAAVLAVAAVFGLLGSPWAILALPVAYLIGMDIRRRRNGDDRNRHNDRGYEQLFHAVHPADVLGERGVFPAGSAAGDSAAVGVGAAADALRRRWCGGLRTGR